MDLVELEPMAGALGGHRLRLTEVNSLADRRLVEWLGALEVLIALDAGTVNAISAACPALTAAVSVGLADALPWGDLYGHPLVPFDAFVRALKLDPSSRPDPCVLRRCALLGAALCLPETGLPGASPVLRRLLSDVGMRVLEDREG